MKYLHSLYRWSLFLVIISVPSAFHASEKKEPEKVITTKEKIASFPMKPRFLLKKLYKEGKFKYILSNYIYKPQNKKLLFLVVMLSISLIIPIYSLFFYMKGTNVYVPYESSKLVKYGIIPANIFFFLLLFTVISENQKYGDEGRIVFTDTGIAFVNSKPVTESQWIKYENVKKIVYYGDIIDVKEEKDFAFCYFNGIKNEQKGSDIYLERNQLGDENFNEVYNTLVSLCMKYRVHLASEKIKKDIEEASQRISEREGKSAAKLTRPDATRQRIPEDLKKYVFALSEENDYHVTKIINYCPLHKTTFKEYAISFACFAILIFLIKKLIFGDYDAMNIFFSIPFCTLSHPLGYQSARFIYYILILLSPVNHYGFVLTDQGLFILPKKVFPEHSFFKNSDMMYLLLHPLDFERVSILSNEKTLDVLDGSKVGSEEQFKSLLLDLQEQIVINHQNVPVKEEKENKASQNKEKTN